jgi:uncharacterized repeat protein (TIGR03803 family)
MHTRKTASVRSVTTLFASTLTLMLLMQAAQAQTFSVLHNFSGGGDGYQPDAGLTVAAGGDLYGTALAGGYFGGFCESGCGTVFKLIHSGTSWVLSPIYAFRGAYSDGEGPAARVVFGPDGDLYGTTFAGGTAALGTVFRLIPPIGCSTALCPWTETTPFSFPGGERDGAFPGYGDVVFDSDGNLYGTTTLGGVGCNLNCGTVYELSTSNGGWIETVIYQFSSGQSSQPYAGVIFDISGNLYGTTSAGGTADKGTVYELTPDGGSWSQSVLYSFLGQGDGSSPHAGLIFDQSGNVYGTTGLGGSGGGGTVFELSPAGRSWTYSLIYSFSGSSGPAANLTMDSAGNLYGTTYLDGAYGYGNVFKLTRSNGSWNYTSLHDFTGGSDGGNPISNVVFDAAGNMYGTTAYGGTGSACGAPGCGVVWEITP